MRTIAACFAAAVTLLTADAFAANPGIEELRAKAQERMALDRQFFSADDFRQIETLYQGANRNLRAPDAAAKLEDLVARFPKSNRAGCAVMYLAQRSNGAERQRLLEQAISQHENAWYGNGVQVGAFARAMLAAHYANSGRLDDAMKLAEEVATRFPGAVDHAGKPLADALRTLNLLPKAE